MKRVFFAVCVAALAVPLCAQQEDSPLVRAAKASGRVTKKAKVVITNDTLIHTGGHIATTDVTTPIKLNPDYGLAGEFAKTPTATAPAPTPPASGAMQVSQPTTATSSQPPAAPTSQITTMTTTSMPTAGSTQPTVATARPPQQQQ